MDRALCMCTAGRLSCAFVDSRKCGQDSSRKRSVQRNGLRTQLLERSFQRGETFFENELPDHVAWLARKQSGPAVVVPAVWTMGGGPRTYPGGVRKWQWKRRQRKDERNLEKDRLMRERKIFETRRREELRKTSPHAKLNPGDPMKSSESSELRLSPSNRAASLLSPGSLTIAATGKDSTAEAGGHGKAAEGKPVSESAQGSWTGSPTEVAEQIQKVRNIVSRKYTRLAGLTDNQTTSSFSKLPLSASTLKALTFILDIQNMTALQEVVFPVIWQGADLVARTKVIGEDTIASLIYAIELVLKRRQEELPLTGLARMEHNLTVSGRSPITVVLVCPTHESATFLASEAKLLLMFHPGIRVQVLRGGNDIKKEVRWLRSLPCQIVVATPGRLLNHLQSSPELRGQLTNLRLFVLMEVQKLLDMGYWRTIERISLLISRSRQTMLWSSSVSDELFNVASKILKKNYQVISLCEANKDEGFRPMVRHDFLVVPMECHLALVFSLINMHMEKEPDYKVVVFCQTVRTTTFISETLKNLGFFTCELHMRKNEKHREQMAAVFRTMKGGVILCTCGASVWGVANPDVTLILQIGQPAGREQYVRRLTLSGQETKHRECILLLMPHEQLFLKELSAVPLWELTPSELNSDTEGKVQHAVQEVDSLVRVKAYLAWLRYHVARAMSSPDKQEAVRLASMYCNVLGFDRPPQLNTRTMKALGLTGILDPIQEENS